MASEPKTPPIETPISQSPDRPAQRDEPSQEVLSAGSTEDPTRRDLLSVALNTGVVLSLGASYGTLAGHAVDYLVPTHSEAKAWLYVAPCRGITLGSQVKYTAPSGAAIAVARVAAEDSAASFIALSSTCPHMGCQVLWEGSKSRFFCPCHNGVFNERGEGTDGPPKGQSLSRYPIRVENGLLFVEVPLTALPRERGHSAQACRQPVPLRRKAAQEAQGAAQPAEGLHATPAGGRSGDESA